MLYYYINSFTSLIRILNGRYWYSQEWSYSQKTSNLIFFSTKKRFMAGEMILISINIVMAILSLLLVLLGIINIILQIYYFLIY